MSETTTPLRITADEARTLRYAASSLRYAANLPYMHEGAVENMRMHAAALDWMTRGYPPDWPTALGLVPADWPTPPTATTNKEDA